MTGRERMLAAASGAPVDRQPVLAWPHPDNSSDAMTFQADAAADLIATAGDKMALVEIINPFGLAVQREIVINDLLAETPHIGDRILAGLVDDVNEHIRCAFENGADGIIYRLHGARAFHCTPMQYGGHYLERDREILASIAQSRFNAIFVVGEEDVYLDFVSDLPAHAFGWDSEDSKIGVDQVRAMRKGALISTDPTSDIRLDAGTENISKVLEANLYTEEADV